MPSFSTASLDRLATCHPDIQRVLHEAIKYVDFTVVCGHRDEAAQATAFMTGKSKLRWPHSNHNTFPSTAVDLAPCPINWNDLQGFHYLAGVVMTVAKLQGVKLDWGGHWLAFVDRPHFELAG